MIHSTFVLERNYPASPNRVFSAFSEPALKRRWYAESATHEVEHFELDFREGGVERAVYRMNDATPFPGVVLESSAVHLHIVPERRIVVAAAMSLGGQSISASLITIEFVPAGAGTRLILTHQGAFFEGADGPEMREAGWRTLLDGVQRALDG